MEDANRANEQARRLAQVIVAPHDQAACLACLDTLEDYITAQLAGDDYVARFPAIAQHLDQCLACAESYALLFENRLAATSIAPSQIPQPDLAFLAQAPANQPGSLSPQAKQLPSPLREALEQAVERIGARLRLTFSQPLLDLLPPPAPAAAFRSGTAQSDAMFDLDLQEPGSEISRLQLTAYLTDTSGVCAVRVQVGLQGRDWPDLEQVPITLALGSDRRQAQTDPWGEVVFTDVPLVALPEMQVEVEAI